MRIPAQAYVTHFNPQLPHHLEWLSAVLAQLEAADPGALQEGSPLRAIWATPAPPPPPQAGAGDIENSWDGVLMAARIAGAKWPELVAAQWQLESRSGTELSGLNNLFGLKGTGTKKWTSEQESGQLVRRLEEFMDFPTRRAAVEYLVRVWYREFKGMPGVNSAPNIEAAARMFLTMRPAYATDGRTPDDPLDYADKLINVLRGRGVLATPPKLSAPAQQPPKRPSAVLLVVKPEFQNDNASGRGYRECFSSSCAMLARFRGKIGSDDEYNKVRARFGDTTDVNAQLRALRHLGLKAEFTKNNSFTQLEDELIQGNPVALGWLHLGTVARPTGSGHWSVGIGFTATHTIHNDPQGEADLVRGGYVSTGRAGAGISYSRQNWGRRWMCDDRGNFTPGRNGWMLTCRP